jgi:uncharacterized peroxidase-related enzyme
MSRIPAIDPASAQGKAKDLLDAVNKLFGVTPNLFRVTAQSPAALEGLINFQGALGKGKLGPKARGVIALAVAEANACDYCLSAHTALAKGAGLNDADIALAREGNAAEPKLEAITRFARSLVQSRGRANDTDLAQLRKAGVNDGEIIEVVGNVVVNIFTNYLNHVAGTDIDFPVVRAISSAAA